MSHVSRNRAIAYLLESKGIIETGVEKSLDFYTRSLLFSVWTATRSNPSRQDAYKSMHRRTGCADKASKSTVTKYKIGQADWPVLFLI